MMRTFIQSTLLTLLLSNVSGAIKTETIEYMEGNTALEGVLIYDDSRQSPGQKQPGVLIAHQWKGLTEYEKKRGEMLAELGYVAFGADIYGKGIRAKDPQEAAQVANKYKNDRELLRRRVQAGFEQLRKSSRVDAGKIAAIGYCFGGTTVLELARSGSELKGIVSFHGALATPTPADAVRIKAKVLVLHGADDPFVPAKEVLAFEDEMRNGKVDWQLTAYGGAVHSFTDWNAGNDNSKGAAYNEKADQRSWEQMKQFFQEIFGRNRD
jgi:dienelactone hydrolase